MNLKNKANQVLLLVFILFLVAMGLKYFYKDHLGVKLFFAVMEAALVGGIADWFAITAIFEKPLGFPWHTALIPRHRQRVINAIQKMVDQELLTIESIKSRVNHTEFITLLISFIENKRSQELLTSWLETSGREWIHHLHHKESIASLEVFLRNEMKKVNLSSQIKIIIRWLLQGNRVQVLTFYVVDQLIHQLEKSEMKQSMYKYMENMVQADKRPPLERAFIWLGEQTNSINLSDAVSVFYGEIVEMLHEIKHPEHSFHHWIHEKLTEFLEQPEEHLIWLEEIEGWKEQLANELEVNKIILQMAETLQDHIHPTLESQYMGWFYRQIHQYWTFFKNNQEIQQWLERRIKEVTYRFIEKEHHIIGEMVQEVLSAFTDEKLNTFVQEKAGDDFQWIRINGSVVGGLVGLMVFLFFHYFYEPYLLPVLQGYL